MFLVGLVKEYVWYSGINENLPSFTVQTLSSGAHYIVENNATVRLHTKTVEEMAADKEAARKNAAEGDKAKERPAEKKSLQQIR